ncbi:MAG: SOS response-associated peptidase, partial [Rothia sp. (in: high G+C Gram-positive bacteria)]|nr:SOS response-associated peptidase [Rothia sp. (in: high G+C Gram-positive bacteria)]
MCGRYALELALEHPQYLAGVELGEPIASYNVAPTHAVPILVDRLFPAESLNPAHTHDGAGQDAAASLPGQGQFVRELHSARWGLLPSWAKDPSFASRAFNARSETIFEKPTFREAAVAGHCAIPVSGYYEWKTKTTAAGKTAKTPYFVHQADGRPIYLVGLYAWWKIPAAYAAPGAAFEGQEGQWLLSCSIVTMDSPGHGEFDTGIMADLGGEPPYAHPMEEALGQLHNRLPIPLEVADDTQVSEADSLTNWLRSGRVVGAPAPQDPAQKAQVRTSAQEALELIRKQAFAQTHGWAMHPVSKDVGRVSNNAPYLIEPVEDLLSDLSRS